ncbi:MAG: hypothetical protein JWR15_2368, partial [Prosthecobacter sp.]|nr:hypothetical protein [Prosthecobacter sp.]
NEDEDMAKMRGSRVKMSRRQHARWFRE